MLTPMSHSHETRVQLPIRGLSMGPKQRSWRHMDKGALPAPASGTAQTLTSTHARVIAYPSCVATFWTVRVPAGRLPVHTIRLAHISGVHSLVYTDVEGLVRCCHDAYMWLQIPQLYGLLREFRYVAFLDTDAYFAKPDIPIHLLMSRWGWKPNSR